MGSRISAIGFSADLDRIKQILPDGVHGERSRESTVPTWT
jgi:hypothetical protein